MRKLVARLWHSPTFTTWSSLATRLLSVTLVLPLVLVKFSAPEIVVYQLFATISTLQVLVDFGFSPTFSRLVAYTRGGAGISDLATMSSTGTVAATGPRNEASLLAVVGTLRVLYTRLAISSCLVFAALGTLALLKPMSEVGNSHYAWAAWAVVVPTTAIGYWGGAFSNVLMGLNNVALVRRWETAFAAGQIVSATLVLLCGGSLLALVLANQLWPMAGALRNRLLLSRLEAPLIQSKPILDATVFSVAWPAAWRSGLGIIMSYGIIQTSGLLYTQFARANDVASYLLALRAINAISQFSQAPFYSKLPGLAHLYALNDRTTLVRHARKGMRLSHSVMLAGILAVLALAQPLLSMIGSSVDFVPPTLWLIIALAFFVERYGAMHLQLYSLTNHIVWHVAAGVTGVLMLTFALLLFPTLGIYAMPVAMLLGHLGFYTWYSARHSFRAFGMHFLSFESMTSLPQFACLILILAASTQVRS